MKFIMAPYLLPHPTDGLQMIPSGGSLGVGNGLGGAFHGNRLPMRKVLAEAISIAGIDTDSNGGNGGVVEYDGGGVHSLLWDNGTGTGTANANGRTPAITVANIFSTVEACGSGGELGPVDKFQDDADVNFSSATGGGYCGSGLVVADQVLGDHAATYDGGSCGEGGLLLPEAVAIEYGNLVEMKDNNKLVEEEETILALLLGVTKGSDAFKALPLMSNKLMSEKKYKKSNKKGDKLSGEYGGAKGNMASIGFGELEDDDSGSNLALMANNTGEKGKIGEAISFSFTPSDALIMAIEDEYGSVKVEEVTVANDDGTNGRDNELRIMNDYSLEEEKLVGGEVEEDSFEDSMEEDESSADIVVGYVLEEEDVLLEYPLSKSWSFFSVPNMAACVGYQDEFVIDREEKDGGRVVSNDVEEKEVVPMHHLWHHHSIFLLIGVLLFVGTVLTALFFSPSFMECVHFLVDAAACSEPADIKFNGMLNPTSALLLGGGKYRVTSFSSSSEAAKIKKDIVDGCKKDNDPLPDNTRKSWHVSCELTIAVASLGSLIFVIITMFLSPSLALSTAGKVLSPSMTLVTYVSSYVNLHSTALLIVLIMVGWSLTGCLLAAAIIKRTMSALQDALSVQWRSCNIDSLIMLMKKTMASASHLVPKIASNHAVSSIATKNKKLGRAQSLLVFIIVMVASPLVYTVDALQIDRKEEGGLYGKVKKMFGDASVDRGSGTVDIGRDLESSDPIDSNPWTQDLIEESSTSNVAPTNTDKPEPFTLGSIQPDIIADAVEEAREQVFDSVADDILEALGVDEIPSFVDNIPLESIGIIQSKLIECFENLGDGLDYLKDITDSIESFTPDKGLSKVLTPEERASCSPPNLSLEDLSDLPDITSAKDSARALSIELFDCFRDTISEVDLGFTFIVPDIDIRRHRHRHLLETSSSPTLAPTDSPVTDSPTKNPTSAPVTPAPTDSPVTDSPTKNPTPAPVCPPPDPDWAVTVGLGASVDASFRAVREQYKGNQYDVSISTSTGGGIEAGYESNLGAAFGMGFSAPLTIFAVKGKKTDEDCPAGYTCKRGLGGVELEKCPQGSFCLAGGLKEIIGDFTEPDGECSEGHFCPEGSTSEFGEPVSNYKFTDALSRRYTACIERKKCQCRAGYYCPKGSTTPTGKPVNTQMVSVSGKTFTCSTGATCSCPVSHYCVAGSDEPEKCPQSSRPLEFPCQKSNCRNPQCTFDTDDPQAKKSYLENLAVQAFSRSEVEFGIGLAVNIYWDSSAATFNGGNGFFVSIDLPFEFLPSISLLFGSAAPWHCLGRGSPTFNGISLDILDVKEAFKSVKSAAGEIIEAEGSTWTTIKDRVKQKWRKFDFQDFLNKKISFSDEVSFGVGYSYDASFNDVPARYKWCGSCESCSDCEVCAETTAPDGADDACIQSKTTECNERQQCGTSRALAANYSSFESDIMSTSIATSSFGNSNSMIRALQTDDSEEFARLITVFTSIFSGNMNLPFCFGTSCSDSPRNPTRVIEGIVQSKYTQDCGGLTLSATLPQLTLSQIFAIILDELPESDFLDPMYEFGINKELELSLTVGGTSELTLRAALPSQSLPPNSFDSSEIDVLEKIILFIKLLRIELYAKVERTTLGPDFIAGTCVSLGLDNDASCLALTDVTSPITPPVSGEPIVSIADDRLQFNYFLFQLGLRKPPGLPLWESFLEFAVGMKICPTEACTGSTSFLFLQGSVRGELGVTGFSVGGGLRQFGTYYNAFGSDRLHLADFYANIQFGVKFPAPDSFNIGGQACIGLKHDCDVADPDSTVRLGAFVGFNVDVPADNYIVAFVQKLTLDNVLKALGMDEFDLPSELGASGILPPLVDGPNNCSDEYILPTSTNEAAVGLPPLDLACVAYIAITSKEVNVPGISGSIRAGYSVAGRLLLQYGVLLDLSLSTYFNPLTTSFEIDGKLRVDLPAESPVATIRQSGVNDLGLPARFYVAGSPASLAVKIDARLDIPSIKTYGDVDITLDSTLLEAEGELVILGILKSRGKITFYWDMSYLMVAVDTFGFEGYFELRNILLEFKSNGGSDFELRLNGEFAVAGFDAFAGSLEIAKNNAEFTFGATLTLTCVLKFNVGGTFNLLDLADSSVSTFDIGADMECLEAIGQFIEEGVEYLVDSAVEGLNYLEDELEQICENADIDPTLGELSCGAADVIGGLSSFISGGKSIIYSTQDENGLAKDLHTKETVFDCLAYVPITTAVRGSDGLYSWGELSNSGSLNGIFLSDWNKVNPSQAAYNDCYDDTGTDIIIADCTGTAALGLSSASFSQCAYAAWTSSIIIDTVIFGSYNVGCGETNTASTCPGSGSRSSPVYYANDLSSNNIEAAYGLQQGDFTDDKGCERLAYYKPEFSATYSQVAGSATLILGSSFLGIYNDLTCYNKVIQLEEAVAPIEEQVQVVTTTRNDNACLLEDYQGNGPRILMDDAYEIPDATTSYENAYVIDQIPSETTDGIITLKYQTREFTNDGNGGCTVSNLVDKTCDVIIPKGPDGTLNRFLEQRLQVEYTKCVTGSLVENQGPIPQPELAVATLEFQEIGHSHVTATCSTFDSTKDTYKPMLAGEDQICQDRRAEGKDPQFFFDDSNPEPVTDGEPCGTYKITRTWTAVDGCGQDAASSIKQMIFVRPQSPTFDVDSMPNLPLTTSQFPVPSRPQYPNATTYCGGSPYISYEDVAITKVVGANGCNSWTMRREWRVREELAVCEEQDRPTSAPLIQTIRITDDTLPKFVDPIRDARVPFFANYQPNNNVPRVQDSSANDGYGKFSSQLVNNVVLQSTDDNLTIATMESNQTTCSTDGLAKFIRSWTISDTCGNVRRELQSVIIENPSPELTSTDPLEEGSFARSPGVSQISDTCAPGKYLRLQRKLYITTGPNCLTDNWNEDGCQVNTAPGILSLLAIKPEFTYRPPNVTITTNDSRLPSFTGQAVGETFCGEPFEVFYTDPPAPQKEEECGTWTIERKWTIRPVYSDCIDVSDHSLVHSFVQKITIKDTSPPEFINKPSIYVIVPFLQNYGPDITGVPLVEDSSSSDLVDDQGLPLASYPIKLTYDDSAVFTDLDDCDQEALAVIERKWAATDYCDQTSTWTQTILIERSSRDTIGEASVYQVLTTGPSHLSHTDIAEEFVTSGKDKTSMDHVLLSSGLQTTAWNGLNPDLPSRRLRRRLQSPNSQRPDGLSQNEYNLHPNRGVTVNPSTCSGNYGSHDLIMEICPEFENIKDVFLVKNSAAHGPESRPQNGNSDRQCVLDKLQIIEENATLSYLKDGEQSLRFNITSKEIERFSDTLAYEMPDLVTGPKSIICLSQGQSECSVSETSISNQNGEVRIEDGEIDLKGTGMIYNFFDVPISDWFYLLPEPRRPGNKKDFVAPSPKVMVNSTGFVFVNVKYQSTLKLSESKKGQKPNLQPSVRHDFQTSEEDEFYFKYPQLFGDAVWPDLSSTSTSLIVSESKQWVPRKVEFSADTLGQEYFLVNVPNPEINNQDNVTNEKELAALAISFTDSEAVEGPIIWPGTLVIGNRHTSLTLKNSTLVGGQLFLAGGRLELTETSVLCGKFAANRPCSPKRQQPLE